MKSNALRWTVGLLAVALVLASATAVPVREGQTVLVTRFGELVAELDRAGLHWKLPWPIDRALVMDCRQRVFNTRHGEMLTRDKKNVILRGYAVWRIDDPPTYMRAVGSLEAAEEKLESLIVDAQAKVLGRYDLTALVSTDPALLAVEEIETELHTAVAATASERYGIAIEHVGFKRLSLNEENVSRVFEQMRSERAREAARYRAEGNHEATKIRSEADEQKAEILAAAREEAARLLGEAEAEAAATYAAAQALDPELYRFLRHLESLERLLGEDARLILRTDSAPFQLLGKEDAWREAATPGGGE